MRATGRPRDGGNHLLAGHDPPPEGRNGTFLLRFSRSNLLPSLLWAVALAGLLYLAGLTAWLGGRGLLFPYQLDYGEGVQLHYVRELLAGRPIYRPIGRYPYITANYPPLTFLLTAALTPLLGLTYAAGRLWTLLALAAVAAIMVAWLRRETGRWGPGLVAALLFLGSPYIYHWAPLFRVDLVGLALTLAGLYVIFENRKPGGGAYPILRVLLAAVLFVAALYAKQSFLFAPAAAILYLWASGDRRRAIILAAAIALPGGSIFVAVNAATAGSFWESLVVANVNPFLWDEFWKQQADFFGTFAPLVLLTALYAVGRAAPFFRRRGAKEARPGDGSAKAGGRRTVRLLDLYLPLALLGVLLAGKAGAWENYFFEALAALSLGAGLGLARLCAGPGAATNEGKRGQGRWLAPLLVLAQVILMWHTPRVANRYMALTRASYEAMAPIMAATPDPLFAEDMGLLVTFGKVLDYHAFEYSQLAAAGRWDQSWELGELRSRRRTLVILDRGTRLDPDRYRRFTRAFLSELDRNYRHARSVGKFELYAPDPLQYERHAAFGDDLALIGWSLHAPPDVQPGDAISLTVVWQAQRAMESDYTAFAHLVDENGRGRAGDDRRPHDGLYPTSKWAAGEMVRDIFHLTVPADTPPGLYDIRSGWYDPADGRRLPVGGGDSLRLAVLPVAWPTAPTAGLTPLEAAFRAAGATITLRGYKASVRPGAVNVTLRWATDGYPDADYTVFLHLVPADDGEQVVAQGDAPPLDGRWPTSLWRPGAELDDTHTIPLPADLPPGVYRLLVGLYDPVTGARLPLLGGGDALPLTTVQIAMPGG